MDVFNNSQLSLDSGGVEFGGGGDLMPVGGAGSAAIASSLHPWSPLSLLFISLFPYKGLFFFLSADFLNSLSKLFGFLSPRSVGAGKLDSFPVQVVHLDHQRSLLVCRQRAERSRKEPSRNEKLKSELKFSFLVKLIFYFIFI